MDKNYQSLGMNAVLEKENQRKRRSRLLVIISVAVLLILIAIGVTVGVIFAKKTSNEKASSGARPSGNGPKNPVSGDPTKFTKDERFHQAFYGLAYTPEGSLPDYGCAISLAGVIEDVQIMSQLTKRIRLYGSDCNQTAMVLEAIRQTKVDVEVYVGNYVVTNDASAYQRQRQAIKEALETYGTDHIAGITVGNEFMLNWVTTAGFNDPNTPAGNEGALLLKADIDDTRQMVRDLGLSVPIGNSDAGSFFHPTILANIDYGMSNVHAWFANTTAAGASAWVNKFFQTNNIFAASQLPNNPKMYIAETGWPTGSSTTLNPSPDNGVDKASVQGLQTFMDTFVCEANQAGVGYFFFEFKDEEWKDTKYGGVEGHWGLFTKDKVLKEGLTIPTCVAP